MSTRLVITGAAGFIGRNLLGAVRGRPDVEVLALDIEPRGTTGVVRCDIRDRRRLIDMVRTFKPNVIYHLAARTDLRGRQLSDYSSNVQGVQSVIEAARSATSDARLVFTSSRLVHHPHEPVADFWDWRPVNTYGYSKVVGESLLLNATDIDSIIARPTSIWGPGFHVPYRTFFEAVMKGRYVHAKGRRVLKTLGYVDNTVAQLLALGSLSGSQGSTHHGYYLGDYEPVDVEQWALAIASRAPRRSKVHQLPAPVLRAAASLGQGLEAVTGRPMPLTTARYHNLYQSQVFDLGSIIDVLPSLPVDITEGVARTVDWLCRPEAADEAA